MKTDLHDLLRQCQKYTEFSHHLKAKPSKCHMPSDHLKTLVMDMTT